MAYSISVTSWQTTNEATNQSTVYAYLTLTATNQGYSGYSTSGNVNIGGQNFSFGGPSALNTDGSGTETWQSLTYSRTYDHNTNGERGEVGTSGTFTGGGGFSPGSLGPVSGTTQGALNYDRKPGTAGTVTAFVNNDKSITVNVGNTASLASSPTFKFAYSSDNGATWSSVSDGTTSLVSGTTYTGQKVYTGLTPGATYLFRAYATNSDGTGATTTMVTGVFLMSGGKRWNGTAWVPITTFKRWNGTAWVNITTAKRWNGSAWVNLQ